MMPILQLGPFSLPTSALIILLGLWLGISLSERNAPRYTVHANHLSNLILIALVSGLIGARFAYVARYLSAFAENPLDVISRNPGLLDPLGGIAIGVIAAAIYGQRKRLSLWPTLDSLTPGLAIMGVALALSHLASGNAFGKPTDLPWGIELWDDRRHPTQIYEILIAVIILLAVWPGHWIMRSKKAGTLFLSFISFTAAAHLFLESFRGDSILLVFGIRRDQFIAWFVLAISLWGLGKIWYSKIDIRKNN